MTTTYDTESLTVDRLVRMGYEVEASDVFVKAGHAPAMRQHGTICKLADGLPILDAPAVEKMLRQILNTKQTHRFEETFEMDMAIEVGADVRVRCNLYHQRGSWAAVFRIIPISIRSLEQLGMPPVLGELTKNRLGLILVTGPTGCGKTTTLAAMIDQINQERPCHIVTIEDPLEFVHADKQAYVSQREVGIDTEDFDPALRAVVREAPDVILIGEMRDVKTMNVALQAGETGHLVFSTVHTSAADETLDRIVNMFPPHEKNHICQRLATSLRAVVAQKLVPRQDGLGRVAASEVLVCTPTVSKAIEDGHFGDLYGLMNEGGFWGMQTMNQSLVRYVKAGVITEQAAMNYAGIASELRQMLRR